MKETKDIRSEIKRLEKKKLIANTECSKNVIKARITSLKWVLGEE